MKKFISVIIALMMIVPAMSIHLYAIPGQEQLTGDVELTMPVPKVGDEINNPPISTNNPNVVVSNAQRTYDGSDWVDDPDADDNSSIGGHFKKGIYYHRVFVKPADGYVFGYSKVTLNGVAPVKQYKRDPYSKWVLFLFPVMIGNGTLADKVDITFKQPNIGENLSVSGVIISAPHTVMGDPGTAFWSASVNSNDALSGAFEDGKTYYLRVNLRAEAGYYFSKDTAVTVNGKKLTQGIRINENDGSTLISISYEVKIEGHIISPFIDTRSNFWYSQGIKYCYYHHLMDGMSPNTFRPNNELTRAMFVTILAKLDGAELSEISESSFADVPVDQWYAKAVEWAYKNGYTSGMGDNCFSPNSIITRQQLAQFLYTYSKAKGYIVTDPNIVPIDNYTDRDSIADWAIEAVKWAVASGFITGTGENTLSPAMTATRAQVAVIMMNFREFTLGPRTVIDSLNLTIPVPVKGETAETAVVGGLPEGCTQITENGFTHWTDTAYDYGHFTGIFEENSDYYLYFTLRLDEGYEFVSGTTVTVNGTAEEGCIYGYKNYPDGNIYPYCINELVIFVKLTCE